MTATETFVTGRKFLTPAFRIKLEGQDTGRELIADVLEVSFTSDLENIDSFEFVLVDWDPVGLRPRYSSPWDESGTPLRLPDDGPPVPNFEPGSQVSLYMGFLEDGPLPKIMDGEVVSLAPSFPASGVPTCRVRALNAFLRNMQKTHVEGNYSGTDKVIVETLCREHGIPVRFAALDSEGDPRNDVEVEGSLYDAIAERANGYGLSITVTGTPETLYLAQPSQSNDAPVAEFLWGRTLVSFTPALSSAGQVSEVVARGGDPSASGTARAIEATRTWSDIGLSPTALGPAGQADIDTGVSGIRQVIKPEGVRNQADAERAAEAKLRELAATLITGSGVSIGLPELRAGVTVTMVGLGARFDGTWRLTQATHTIGGSGYTTSFQARKEVLDG